MAAARRVGGRLRVDRRLARSSWAGSKSTHAPRANLCMDAYPAPIKAGLAALTEAELHALISASDEAPPIAYGLLVWT